MKNILFFRTLNSIGGIETTLYEIAKKYKERDITIIYKGGSKAQEDRLRKLVRLHKYIEGEIIECEKAFYNLNIDIIENVNAKEHILVLHGDYKSLGILPETHSKITGYLAVSQLVANSYKELTGIEPKICYNPITIEEQDKEDVLLFVSASRLTDEKGGWRYPILADAMQNAGIKFIWLFFTDNKEKIKNKNIVCKDPTLDIRPYIKKADALIQLSNNEGFGYSPVEAWCLGTKVIATKLPVLYELGANGDNSVLIDFNMKNIPIEEIKNIKKCAFKYEPPKDIWGEILTKDKSMYEGVKMIKVEALDTYEKYALKDGELGFIPNPGHIWEITEERFKQLTERPDGRIFVKKVEEAIEKPKKGRKNAK